MRRATEIENEAIFTNKNRKKRQVLQGMGSFLARIFGFLTMQDKFIIETELFYLNQRSKATIKLVDSHTAVLKSLIDNSQQFTDRANKNMEALYKSLIKGRLTSKDLADKLAINSYLWEMSEILRDIQNKYNLIFIGIQVKRLNPILINIKDLKLLLAEIESNFSKILFELDSVEKYYNNLVLNDNIYKDYIAFSWEIPI